MDEFRIVLGGQPTPIAKHVGTNSFKYSAPNNLTWFPFYPIGRAFHDLIIVDDRQGKNGAFCLFCCTETWPWLATQDLAKLVYTDLLLWLLWCLCHYLIQDFLMTLPLWLTPEHTRKRGKRQKKRIERNIHAYCWSKITLAEPFNSTICVYVPRRALRGQYPHYIVPHKDSWKSFGSKFLYNWKCVPVRTIPSNQTLSFSSPTKI